MFSFQPLKSAISVHVHTVDWEMFTIENISPLTQAAKKSYVRKFVRIIKYVWLAGAQWRKLYTCKFIKQKKNAKIYTVYKYWHYGLICL